MEYKINCQHIKQLYTSTFLKEVKNNTITPQLKNNSFSHDTYSTSEVHENNVFAEKLLLDIRTYLCAHGKCQLHHKRSHRRLSIYNWNKMLILTTNINQIISLANKLVSTEMQNKQLDKNINNNRPKQFQKNNCVFCNNPKLTGIIHIHFVKEQKEATKVTPKDRYKPIESVFSQIDEISKTNARKIRSKEGEMTPGNLIQQNNCYRMSYGDINYLGNNKALLYFDRGKRGIQTYANSMSPLKNQPKYMDLIVLDDIVFTSTCKCDSILQHREMFPHYRVTCAVGLTCPARLSNIEKEIYRRRRNASTEMFTTARSMLSRYWS